MCPRRKASSSARTADTRSRLAIAALSSLAVGCASGSSETSAPLAPSRLVAENVVSVLVQVDPLAPTSGPQGRHYVRYSDDASRSESGERLRYRVAIGVVSVERDFDVVDGRTMPRSVQVVEGAPEQPIRLDDAVFGNEATAGLSNAVFETPTLIEYAAAYVPEGAVLTPGSADAFRGVVKRNLFDAQGSNYAALFADYEDVRRDALIFGNDSVYLGRENKAIIAEYVRDLDPATDILSVIGCSHGRSALPNGNQLLAIGRANRVKEAFLYAGLSHEQVLEESCWAGEYHARFPKRGVVVTLKRRVQNG